MKQPKCTTDNNYQHYTKSQKACDIELIKSVIEKGPNKSAIISKLKSHASRLKCAMNGGYVITHNDSPETYTKNGLFDAMRYIVNNKHSHDWYRIVDIIINITQNTTEYYKAICDSRHKPKWVKYSDNFINHGVWCYHALNDCALSAENAFSFTHRYLYFGPIELLKNSLRTIETVTAQFEKGFMLAMNQKSFNYFLDWTTCSDKLLEMLWKKGCSLALIRAIEKNATQHAISKSKELFPPRLSQSFELYSRNPYDDTVFRKATLNYSDVLVIHSK